MQVLPKDTGWETLANTFMKLAQAENEASLIHMKALMAQREYDRQMGVRSMAEKSAGYSLPVDNPLYRQSPEGPTPLEQQLSGMIIGKNVQQGGRQGAVMPENSLDNLLKLQASGVPITPDVISGMANITPQQQQAVKQNVNISRTQQAQYQARPEIQQKEIQYKDAADAANQLIKNFHQAITNDPRNTVQYYNQTSAALIDLGERYRRPYDPRIMLGPLKLYASGSGKPPLYEARSNLATGGLVAVFASNAAPGSPEHKKAAYKALRALGNVKQSDVAGIKLAGKGTAPYPNAMAALQDKTTRENSAKSSAKIVIDSNMSDKEKKQALDALGEQFNVIIPIHKGIRGLYINDDEIKSNTILPGASEGGNSLMQDVWGGIQGAVQWAKELGGNNNETEAAKKRLDQKFFKPRR
jgi:hypothetical protein